MNSEALQMLTNIIGRLGNLEAAVSALGQNGFSKKSLEEFNKLKRIKQEEMLKLIVLMKEKEEELQNLK